MLPDFTKLTDENHTETEIRDLRYQISALRRIAEDFGMTDREIEKIQFAHQVK